VSEESEPRRAAAFPASRRWVLWILGAVTLLAGSVTAGILRLQAEPLDAPDWMTARVSAQVDALLPDATVSFRTIRLGLDLEFHPQVYLDNVTLTRADGAPLLDLRSVQGDLSSGALLGGDVLLRRLELSGAVLRVERTADGTFDVALGQRSAEVEALSGVADVFGALDELFARPELVALSEISAEGVTVNYTDAASGQVWIGDGGQLRLFREGQNLLLTADAALLTGRQDLAALSISMERDGQTGEATLSAVIEDAAAEDIASQAPALAWLSVIDAPVSLAMRAKLRDGALDDLSATLDLRDGALRPNASARPIPFSNALVALDYDRAGQRIRFEEILLDTAWGTASAQGTAQLQDFERAFPREIVGQFRVDNIAGNPGELYDQPRELDKVSLDFRLRLDPFTFDIGQAVAVDGATTLGASGRIAASQDGWDLALDLGLDTVDHARAMELWPPSFRPGIRGWIARNVEAGTLHNARWALRAKAGQGAPDISMTQHFEDASVRVLRTLPSVTGARGSMIMHDHTMTIVVENGAMTSPAGGLLDATGTVFRVPDTRQKPAMAEVYLKGAGTVTAALSVLDLEPFRVMSRANQPVDLTEGITRVDGTIKFPMKEGMRGSDVRYDVTAELSDLRSTKLLENRVLALPAARAEVSNDLVRVSGAGTLGDVAFEGAWSQPIGQGPVGSEVRGEVALSAAALDEFDLALPPGAVGGEGRGELLMRLLPDASPEFTLSSNLEGLTLALPHVSWAKPASQQGELIIEGTLGADAEVSRLEINAVGLSARGSVALTPGGSGLAAAVFERIQVGDWLSGGLIVTGRGAARPPALALRDARLDMRRAAFGAGADAEEGPPLDVQLERLVVTEDIALTDVRAELTTTGALEGRFRARVNGGAQVEGIVEPSTFGPRIILRSQDGGGVVRDAGVFEQVAGGQLQLNLTPLDSNATFDAELKLTDIRVEDASTMAELLSAVSVVGLLEQLDGRGLVFNEVEARLRIMPGQVIVTQSSAVGASLGLSLDGVFNTQSQQMDFQGVISPLYLLNRVGSVFTRRGEGLLGFNFRLRGAADAPEVSVNPFSVLTPAMFREIFRRPPPDMSQ